MLQVGRQPLQRQVSQVRVVQQERFRGLLVRLLREATGHAPAAARAGKTAKESRPLLQQGELVQRAGRRT
jgi:hypothetical protein